MYIAELHKLDDEALGQALAEAFTALPEAEPARLALIRDRLPLTTKAASSTRWAQLLLIGILSGSGLAAAWWGVTALLHSETELQQHAPTSYSAPLLPAPTKSPADNQGNSQPGQNQQPDDRRSPIIFKQEQY